jgi:hypothetical protein
MHRRAEAPPFQGRIILVWANREMAARGEQGLDETREGVARSMRGAR